MPTLMPGAVQKPIRINHGLVRAGGRIDRAAHRPRGTNAVIYHVDAMNAATLEHWFNNPDARASSHLYVLKNGQIEQYLDLDLVSWCNGDGDLRAVTVETQGVDGEPWTPQQVESCARIAAFAHEHYGVPLRLMEDSKTTTTGLGWHRLGIAGDFARLPGLLSRCLVPGGESWSRSRGKTCPGNERILQTPDVLARATELTQPPEEDIMATLDEVRALLREEAPQVAAAVWAHELPDEVDPEKAAKTMGRQLQLTRRDASRINVPTNTTARVLADSIRDLGDVTQVSVADLRARIEAVLLSVADKEG